METTVQGRNGTGVGGRLYGPDGLLLPSQLPTATGYGNYGANTTKNSMIAWLASGGSPDEDIVANLQILRERSRDAWMGIPLAAGAIETLVTSTIGPGLEAQPNVDGETLGLSEEQTAELNLELNKKFSWWSDDARECDFESKLSFAGLQSLAFQTQILSGDTPVLLHLRPRRHTLFDLRIRILESDRVCDPFYQDYTTDTFGGVELSADGEVVAYYIAQSHPLSRRLLGTIYNDAVRVPAYGEATGRRNVLMMMRPERPEQRRGVPILAVGLETLKQGARHFESTTIAAILQSYFTAWITTEMPSLELFNQLLSPQQQADLQWLAPYSVAMGPGVINQLKPGQSVQFGNPAQPTPTFSDFQITLAKFVGSALGIPFEVLLKQFQASYSASRGSLLEFWKRIRMHRKFVVEQFCQPIFEAWLEDAISLDRIDAWRGGFDDPIVRRSLSRCNWTGPSAGSLDPYKEALASEKRLNLLISTVEREAVETNGSSWYENIMQQGRELVVTEDQGLVYPGLRASPLK